MSRVRMGLIGAGRAGRYHGANIQDWVPEAELAGVTDSDDAAALAAALELGLAPWVGGVRAMLQSDGVDAVCITTPTPSHAELVVAAARAGKHIFCEKPLAISLADGAAMLDAVEQAGVKFQIGFMRRFDLEFQAARAALASGELGRIMLIRSVGRGPALPPEWVCDPDASNGFLAEINSHDFDTVRWLGGTEIRRVFAQAAALKAVKLVDRYPGFYDNAVVVGELAGGALFVVDGSCPVEYGYDARVEVLAACGVVHAGDTARSGPQVTSVAGAVRSAYRGWQDRFQAAFVGELRHFAACVQDGISPDPGILDGWRVLQVIHAVRESLRTDRPVTLS